MSANLGTPERVPFTIPTADHDGHDVSRAPQAGLEQFCAAQHPRLVGSLALYTGDLALAEELAQETLARVVRDWAKVATMAAPQAWAHRVAVNLANSRFRRHAALRRARARGGEAHEQVHHDADTADVLAVRAAVAALPQRQRMVVSLRWYADLPLAEIATAMDTSVGTVKSQLHAATEALRRALGDDLPAASRTAVPGGDEHRGGAR